MTSNEPDSVDEVEVIEESEAAIAVALSNYERFHSLPPGSANVDHLTGSSLGIAGWLTFVMDQTDAADTAAGAGTSACEQLRVSRSEEEEERQLRIALLASVRTEVPCNRDEREEGQEEDERAEEQDEDIAYLYGGEEGQDEDERKEGQDEDIVYRYGNDDGEVEESEAVIAVALSNYERFHLLPHGSANVDHLTGSSAGVAGWLTCVMDQTDAAETAAGAGTSAWQQLRVSRSDEEEGRQLRVALLASVGTEVPGDEREEGQDKDEREEEQDEDVYCYSDEDGEVEEEGEDDRMKNLEAMTLMPLNRESRHTPPEK